VPILSLQVYVENAIRYSKVNEIEGGYIEISSYEEGDKIIVEVNDNGVGFDVNDIKDTSFGIKNSRERFKLLLNAEIEIKSEIGSGTNVRIILNNKGISGG
jgi:sensor histidine kinase YesM